MAASKRLLPEQRSIRASAAAYSAHAKHGTRKMTEAAHTAANVTRFENQVDPEGVLSPAERAKRADHARRAHMKLLALRSAKVRRERQKPSAVKP